MLMRRARAYNSSCSQVIFVYLHSFHRNSLFRSTSQKITKKPLFWRSRLFKVIDVDVPKKVVTVLVMISSTSAYRPTPIQCL